MTKNPARSALVFGALLAASLVTVFPLVWMVTGSLMAPGELSASPPPLWPARPSLDRYRELWQRTDLARAFANSLLLAIASALASAAVNVSAGYAFAKLRFAGKRTLSRVMSVLVLVPGQVAMIPLFLLLERVGLVNSYAGVLAPGLANVFGILLVQQYARSIPDELLDAARLDGASELRIFASIVLPLLRPIVVTVAIFAFLGSWNDFLWPLLILTDDARQTLPVALASLSREHAADAELMMAGAVVTIAPALALFLALQRTYLRGLAEGSIKG